MAEPLVRRSLPAVYWFRHRSRRFVILENSGDLAE